MLEPFEIQDDFRIEMTTGGRKAVGYNLLVFDLHSQKEYLSAQPKK